MEELFVYSRHSPSKASAVMASDCGEAETVRTFSDEAVAEGNTFVSPKTSKNTNCTKFNNACTPYLLYK